MLRRASRHVLRRPPVLWDSSPIPLIVAAGVVLILCAVPCAFGSPPFQHIERPMAATTVSLEGSVRVAGGRTVSRGVKVRVETLAGEMINEQPVTTAGQFGFSDIPKVPARVVVTGEGFQPYSQTINFGHVANTYFMNISLTPVTKTPAPPPPSSRTDLTAPKDARKEFEAGTKALGARKIRDARNHLEKAVGIYPCYARAQAELGLVHMVEHKSASAEAALRKAIECDPDYVDSYIELGELLNGDHRYAESRPVLEEGMRRSPGSWQFFYQLGVSYFGMGKNEEAEQAYLKAQSFSSNLPPDVHIKLADVYVKERAFDKAYAQMQAYIEADPNGRFAARTRNVMSQMAAAGVVSPAVLKPTERNSNPQEHY
jgi:Tfp pilus assembly protein PilF